MGCRVIITNRTVDHSTIARFIRRHPDALKALFVQALALCGQRGLVDLSAVAVDGSPMDANAARDANQRLHRPEEIVSRCEDEINALMDNSPVHSMSRVGDEKAVPTASIRYADGSVHRCRSRSCGWLTSQSRCRGGSFARCAASGAVPARTWRPRRAGRLYMRADWSWPGCCWPTSIPWGAHEYT